MSMQQEYESQSRQQENQQENKQEQGEVDSVGKPLGAIDYCREQVNQQENQQELEWGVGNPAK